MVKKENSSGFIVTSHSVLTLESWLGYLIYIYIYIFTYIYMYIYTYIYIYIYIYTWDPKKKPNFSV
jgi:hypothetical protein